MFDYQGLHWDQETESYEDFLERAGPAMAAALADGDAFLANPLDAIAHCIRFRDAVLNKDDSWKEWVAGIKDMDECGRAITELISLQNPVAAMVNDLRGRAREIVKETDPEEWERRTREQQAVQKAGEHLGKALGEVMDELRRALSDDDDEEEPKEPWKN